MLADSKLPHETQKLLSLVPSLIEKTFPIPARFKKFLPSSIAELSHLLTNKRGDRALSYLGQKKYLTAYLYYFLPWNIYRMCCILHNENLALKAGDTITDLGSGPLTFICALWVIRPDLRNISLQINCIDRSSQALEAGKKFFDALRSIRGDDENNLWKINLIHKDIDIRHAGSLYIKTSSSLVCAVNIFNEIYENIPHSNTTGLKQTAVNAAALMRNLASKDALILTVEPGVPQSGKFISFLRSAFMELGCMPVSPCTHAKACPFNKNKWCHFNYKPSDIWVDNAPEELLNLSSAAKIPKERLVFSFLLTKTISGTKAIKENHAGTENIRIISDAFPLPENRYGLYGCCSKGLIMVKGEKKRINRLVSGSIYPDISVANKTDEKSGALITEIK